MENVLAQCDTRQDAEAVAETCRQSRCRNVRITSNGIDKWFVMGEYPADAMWSDSDSW